MAQAQDNQAEATADDKRAVGYSSVYGWIYADGSPAPAPAGTTPEEKRRWAAEGDASDLSIIFRVGAASLRSDCAEGAAVVFRCASAGLDLRLEHPPREVVVARLGVDLLAALLATDHGVDNSLLADFAEAFGDLLTKLAD